MTEDPKFNFEHTITAGQLKALLADVPDNTPVIMSSDAEGNSHSPLSSFSEAMYYPDSTWSGDTYNTPEDLAEKLADPHQPGWDAEDDAAPEGSVRVIELGPVN